MRTGKDTFLFRIANIAYNLGFTPNILTALGLTFGVASGVLFAVRAIPFAFAFGFLSVFCDVLDGTLARKFHLTTKFGLVFDSVSDRINEAAVVLGAIVAGIVQPMGFFAIVGSVSLLASRVVSYRCGFRSDDAPFGRFERLLFILAGLMSPLVLPSTVCFVVAGLFGVVSSIQIAVSLLRRRRV